MDKKYKARLIRILLNIVKIRWFLFIGLLILEILGSINNQHAIAGPGDFFILLISISFIFNFAYYFYLKKTRRITDNALKTIKWMLILLDPLLFTALAYYNGGLATHAQALYFVSVIIAAVLFKPIIVISETLYCSVLYAGLILMDHFGYLPASEYLKSNGLQFSGTFTDKIIELLNVMFILWTGAILAFYMVRLLYQREEQLIKEQNKTKSIIEALTDGLIVFDENLDIIMVNKPAEKIFNIRRKDLVGKNLNIVINNTRLKQVLKFVQNTGKHSKKNFFKEITIKGKDFTKIMQTTIVPVINAKGEHLGIVEIFHDISREKAIEATKSEFIAIAAHQLRTPLSIIKWTLRTVIDETFGRLPLEAKNYLNKTYATNERIIALVNNLLNISRIEQGKFGYNFKLEKIDELIDKTIKDLKNSRLVKNKHLKIKFIKPKEKIPRAKLDENRLRMALQNLIDNAIKYSLRYGTITIKLSLLKKSLQVAIQDDGVGIPNKERPKLFSKFYRGSNVMRMETEGSGLGLFITQNIIKAHGGKIWYESKEKRATTFFFTIPQAEFFVANKPKTELEKFLRQF